MNRRHAMRGMTLIEVMVATTVAGIITAMAFTFFVRSVRYGRVTYEQTELADKTRLARDTLTQDIMAAGYAWEREGEWDSAAGSSVGDVFTTGYFGTAGRGSTINVAWPLTPISGNNSNSGGDVLQLIVPAGTVLGLNASTTHLHFHCYQTDTAPGSRMTLSATNWTAGTAGWLQNRVVVISGSGMTMLTTINNIPTGGVGGILLSDLVANGAQNCYDGPVTCGGCEMAGAPTNIAEALPPNTKGYPAELVRYEVVSNGTTTALARCTFNGGGAPGSCSMANTVVNGIEDMQVRFVFITMARDGSSNQEVVVKGSSLATGAFDNLSDPYKEISPGLRKRKIAGPDPGDELMRLSQVEIGLVVRATRPNVAYAQRGQRPKLFDNTTVYPIDGYRRMSVTFRVPVPSAVAYGK